MDITLLNVDPQATLIIGLLVISMVKLVDAAFARNWSTVVKIALSGIVGALAAFGIDGLTVLVGSVVGLAASGLITAIGYTKKTTVDTVPVVEG